MVVADVAPCESMLRDQRDIVIVARAIGQEHALAAVIGFKPRILLCSQQLATTAQYSLFGDVREKSPTTISVLWSNGNVETADVFTALSKGVLGVIERSDDGEKLARAIRRIDDGEAWVSRKMLGVVRAQLAA